MTELCLISAMCTRAHYYHRDKASPTSANQILHVWHHIRPLRLLIRHEKRRRRQRSQIKRLMLWFRLLYRPTAVCRRVQKRPRDQHGRWVCTSRHAVHGFSPHRRYSSFNGFAHAVPVHLLCSLVLFNLQLCERHVDLVRADLVHGDLEA